MPIGIEKFNLNLKNFRNKQILFSQTERKRDCICIIPYAKGNAIIRDENGFPLKICGMKPEKHDRTHIGQYAIVSYYTFI